MLRPVYTGDFCHGSRCNFSRAEVATSCDFSTILVQFVSARQFRKQKPVRLLKVKLLLKVIVFRELNLKPRQ